MKIYRVMFDTSEVFYVQATTLYDAVKEAMSIMNARGDIRSIVLLGRIRNG